MPENQGEGISRRDLLRKGAVLGGAVVWVTPVVQTLGMGRAFAQAASDPGGKAISYIAIRVTNCSEGDDFLVKWENGGWEEMPGATPSCADKDSLPPGTPGGSEGFIINDGPNASCKSLFIPDTYANCDIVVWVKAGSEASTVEPCRTYAKGELNIGDWTTVCSAIA